MYLQYGEVRQAHFLERPNRFIAHVELEGETVVCHVKNTGRCRELLVRGATVYLERGTNPARRTAWDLIAVEKGHRLINMDAQAPNRIFAQWIRQQEPESWARTDKFLLLEDYLMLWLTGRAVTEKSLLTSTGYFDLQSDDYWDEALALAELDRTRLPQALACGSIVGPVLPEVAEALGLPASACVVTGAMDQTAAALAAGCTRPGTLCETTGTAMVAAAFTAHPQFSEDHHVTIYRHAMPGAYLYLPISNTIGMSLRWFRDEFCRDLDGGYAALDRLAEQVPPGAQGVTFLPYLAGCVDPDNLPEASGGFYGLRLSSTRAACARAILEAAAFQLRDFLNMLSALGCTAQTVTSLGGGAGSALWMQIKADACRRPFHTLSTVQATSRGAAMLAAGALGWALHDAEEQTVYQPQAETADAYEEAYAAYRRVYEALYLQKG